MRTLLSLLKTAAFVMSAWVGMPQAQAQLAEPVGPVARFAGVTQVPLPLGTTAIPDFNAAFYQNELFLLGEAHGVARPQQIDLALLQHLNERAGVRTYVAEVDVVKANYLNDYLRTGEEATLDLVFRSWKAGASQWANKELRAKFQQIRSWNQTLPQNRKIRFLGIDQLQDLPLTADYLVELLRRNPVAGEVQQRADSVVALLRQPAGSALPGVAQRAVHALQQQKMLRRRSRTRAYDDLEHVLVNATYNRSSMMAREKNIFNNFQALYQTQQLEGQKLYGFWGLAHVLQSPLQSGATLFAGLVRQSNLPVRNKVVSLMCVFSECQMLLPGDFLPAAIPAQARRYSQTDKFNHDGPLTLIHGIQELKERTQPGSTTVFGLNNPLAATARQPIQVSYAAGVPKGQQILFKPELPATAYVQYLILVRNSAAVQPLQE